MSKLIKGKTNFETWCIDNKRQDFLDRYDYVNNPNPKTISKGTHKKIKIRCRDCTNYCSIQAHNILKDSLILCNECKIKNRAIKRHNAAVIKNNFEENYPNIAKEWDIEKNKIKPNEVSYGDNHQYYWVCEKCGKSYKTTIRNRILGSRCSRCYSSTSFPEQSVMFYIKRYYNNALNGDNHIGRELDIYIPSLNVAIEYDGVAWHREKKKEFLDIEKERLCKENNIKLVRVRENGLNDIPYNKDTKIIYTVSGDNKELSVAIKKVLQEIGIFNSDVDVDRDKNEILSNYIVSKKSNSLLEKYPLIAEEWDFEKNKPITPDNIDYGSSFNAWWLCKKCGYSYQKTVNARTCRNNGCSVCHNKKLNKGVNDFITWCNNNNMSYLLNEWDYNENEKDNIDIEQVINRGGNIKAHWICPKGHKYIQLIYNRTTGQGCTQCKIEKHQKKCKNIDTGKIYNSLKDASLDCQTSKSKICEACKGKRKTAGGYHWQYIEG